MKHGYIVWFDNNSEREIWPKLKVAISLKAEKPCPPKLVCMHLKSTPTCINNYFWANSIPFNFLLPWDDSKGNWIWPNLKDAISPKSERTHPPKLAYMHVTSTPTYNVHGYFELILFNSIFSLPWSKRENWPKLK